MINLSKKNLYKLYISIINDDTINTELDPYRYIKTNLFK